MVPKLDQSCIILDSDLNIFLNFDFFFTPTFFFDVKREIRMIFANPLFVSKIFCFVVSVNILQVGSKAKK